MKLKEEKELGLFLQHHSDKLILIKFFTTWCTPCHELQRNIEQLLQERKDVVVLEIDAEKFPELAQRPEFNVRAVPALFLFRQGNQVRSVEQLKKFISGS